MKIWQLNAPNKLEHTVAPDLKTENGKAKVKIVKAALSPADVAVYSGELPAKYPVTLGRFAVGQVTEVSGDCYMKKGDRIYFADVTEDEESPDGIQTAGLSCDGYFRDFAIADESNSYVLPSSVSDEAAFFIDAVALAERIIDEANISVGQHVLVVGGGLYSNIFCQILIYHRAVPILADNNLERLDRAKKSGIYYTFHNDDTLKKNILKVTGGKLAEAAVYFSFANKSEPSSIFSLVARNSIVCFASMLQEPLVVNMENALKNNLTVKGITECREFVSTAINILANKAVNYSEFSYENFSEDALASELESCAKNPAKRAELSEEIHIFKFVI
ncbi:MAG: hypothetical protein IIX01_01915 [Clostridia bacterium]|nr:hypothetical protein [Clostridia bacterium]